MSLKKRVQDLEAKVQATGKPKPGKVFVCETDAQVKQAQVECAKLQDTNCVIVTGQDMSLSRALPKDEK